MDLRPHYFYLARQFSPLYVLPWLAGLSVALAWWIERLSTSKAEEPLRKIFGVSYLVMFLLALGVTISGILETSLGVKEGVSVFLLLFLVAIFLRARRYDVRAPMWAANFSFSVVALFVVVNDTFSPLISRNRLTGPVLRSIAAAFPGKVVEVGVPFGRFGNPFSPWFYDDTDAGKRFTIKEFELESIPTSPIVIYQSKLLRDKIPSSLNEYVVREQIGRWSWLSRR